MMDLFYKLLVLLLCILVLSETIESKNETDSKRLTKQLFVTNEYNKKIRPSTDSFDAPTEVYIDFDLVTINGLNEVSETLTTTGSLWIQWNDDVLQWNDTDYGGIWYYHWPQNDVWKPDVVLKNSVLNFQELGIDTQKVEVYNDGTVIWRPFQVFKSSCNIDVKYFPFDTQTCHLKFAAWSYTQFEVSMFSGKKGITTSSFQESSEWQVIDTSWKVEDDLGEASIIFTLRLKRKPLFVKITILLPIVMLSILNVFVFVLPCDSGEKASYAITVFLSFVVFFTIVSSTFPANSDSVSIFSIYVIVQTVQSTCITLIALLMIRCNSFRADVPAPTCFTCLSKMLTCTPCRKHRDRVYSWKKVVNALDLLFFILFSITLTTSSVVCYILVT